MRIHTPENQPLSLLDFEILNLKKGAQKKWSASEFEVVAVLLEGSCTISTEGQRWQLKRRSVFVDTASAVFVSPGVVLTIDAYESTTLALCKARADKKFQTVFIPPEQVSCEWRGGEGFKRRVFNIVNMETETQRIAVGETINEPGGWSSFPPHKHDTYKETAGKIEEVALEEIYYFRLEPDNGFGFQRLYTKDGSFDEAYVIRDGDVTHIPRGYHPVASIPGHSLYYLWMLAGEKRIYFWYTDPEFRWLE